MSLLFERALGAFSPREMRHLRTDREEIGGANARADLTYRGPIIHLFQLERTAQGLYPHDPGGGNRSTAIG